MAEFDLIEMIKARCGSSRSDVRIGIGDDAAVVAVPTDHELVICTDTLVAGVHFPLATDPSDIGWKSLAVNLSDLAAMGAEPAWATLALTLPSADADFVARFAEGFTSLAARFEIALIGGDTTRGPLTITVTTLGLLPVGQAILRNGACVGDALFVTGTLGDAAAGLHSLQSFDESATLPMPTPSAASKALINRLNRPQPRVEAGIALRGLASACIDVSDGLLADLGHVAAASNVGVEVEEDGLPGSAALFEGFDIEICRTFQMTGGDDYELAFTIAESRVDELNEVMANAGCTIARIGRIVEQGGVRVIDRNGQIKVMRTKGWEHFT